jgi:asparagine synthase (glutamine-hydrolysing)
MRTSVAQYLIYEYIPAPATIYQDVYKLLPGGYLNYDGEEIVHGTFSDIQPHQGVYIKEFGEAKDQLSNLLHTAVARRMVADVPVGVFLSGGLDSSTITYFAQELTKHQVKTFSIGFKDASFDESAYAREVARVLGTDHHERIVGSEDLLRIIDTLPQVLDEPMADSSIIPTLLLSEFTREEVSVVLGGDGADEIFWGYDTFLAHRVGEWYERVPRIIQKSIRVLAETLPVSHKYMSFDFKAKRFLSGFETVNIRRNAYWLSAFIPNELVSILNFDVSIDEIFAPSDKYYGANIDFKDSLQEEYIKGYLAEDILVKTDRAGMAFGLEVRAPFLDIDLVDFAVTLDSHYKYRGHTGKFILKEIMKGHLPNHVIERKKKGFNIPIGSWIRSDLKDLFTEKLLNGKLVESGLFKREGLAILLESHLSGQFDHRKKLWALLVLALWMEKWHE